MFIVLCLLKLSAAFFSRGFYLNCIQMCVVCVLFAARDFHVLIFHHLSIQVQLALHFPRVDFCFSFTVLSLKIKIRLSSTLPHPVMMAVSFVVVADECECMTFFCTLTLSGPIFIHANVFTLITMCTCTMHLCGGCDSHSFIHTKMAKLCKQPTSLNKYSRKKVHTAEYLVRKAHNKCQSTEGKMIEIQLTSFNFHPKLYIQLMMLEMKKYAVKQSLILIQSHTCARAHTYISIDIYTTHHRPTCT